MIILSLRFFQISILTCTRATKSLRFHNIAEHRPATLKTERWWVQIPPGAGAGRSIFFFPLWLSNTEWSVLSHHKEVHLNLCNENLLLVAASCCMMQNRLWLAQKVFTKLFLGSQCRKAWSLLNGPIYKTCLPFISQQLLNDTVPYSSLIGLTKGYTMR